MTTITGNIVDVNFMAEFLELTPRRVQQLCSDLGAPKLERGEYDFVAFVKWYITHLRNENEKLKLGDETLYKLEQEDKKWVTLARKVAVMQKMRHLIDRNIINIAWTNEVVAFNGCLTNLENDLGLTLELSLDQKQILKKKINDIRNQLANALNIEDVEELEEIENDNEKIIEPEGDLTDVSL